MAIMSNFELSIVIPTKNRPHYCVPCIESILMFDNDFELIICDSSENDGLAKYIETKEDPRLKYVRSNPSYNMTENFSFALNQAQGEYVIMIGDDDGIAKDLFEVVNFCRANDIEAVTSADVYLEYNWPDFYSKIDGSKRAGKIYIKHGERGYMRSNRNKLLSDFKRRYGQGCAHMPRVYHGLVSRALLNKIKSRCGEWFMGVSPDVSFSYLATTCAEKIFVYTGPLSISGSSGGSNAGRSAEGTHKGSLECDPHMKNYKDYIWPDVVPRFFSVESVWAQASLTAIKSQEQSYFTGFNFVALYSAMLLKHPEEFDAIKSAWRNYLRVTSRSTSVFYAKVIATCVLQVIDVVVRRVKKKYIQCDHTIALNAVNIKDAALLFNGGGK